MEVNKLNWNEIKETNEALLMLFYFSFITAHGVLKTGAVEDLKITFQGVSKVSDESFRDFLKNITDLDFDFQKLTTAEKESLNKIKLYLAEPTEVTATAPEKIEIT